MSRLYDGNASIFSLSRSPTIPTQGIAGDLAGKDMAISSFVWALLECGSPSRAASADLLAGLQIRRQVPYAYHLPDGKFHGRLFEEAGGQGPAVRRNRKRHGKGSVLPQLPRSGLQFLRPEVPQLQRTILTDRSQ